MDRFCTEGWNFDLKVELLNHRSFEKQPLEWLTALDSCKFVTNGNEWPHKSIIWPRKRWFHVPERRFLYSLKWQNMAESAHPVEGFGWLLDRSERFTAQKDVIAEGDVSTKTRCYIQRNVDG